MSTNVLSEMEEEFNSRTKNLISSISDKPTRDMLKELNAILKPINVAGEFKFDYRNQYLKLFINKYKENLSLPLNIDKLNLYKIYLYTLDEKLTVPNVTIRSLYSARLEYIRELAIENVIRLNLAYQ
jgi:hypothetical protein